MELHLIYTIIKECGKKTYLNLIEWCHKTKPKYLLLPGDLYETLDFVNDRESRLFFEAFLSVLSEETKVIISLGNHEVGSSTIKDRLRNTVDKGDVRYLKSLQNPNLIVLDDEAVAIDNTTFIGYTPKLESYKSLTDKGILSNFIEDFNRKGFHITRDKLNVLLCHNPYQISNLDVLKALDGHEQLDIAISGHLHDGYMPKIFDKYIEGTDIGIFNDPILPMSPGVPCRGIRKILDTDLISAQGFRKHTHPIFKASDPINAHDVESVYVKKKVLR